MPKQRHFAGFQISLRYVPISLKGELLMTEVKTKRQSASLDRRKLLADPIMVTTIVVLIAFLTLFILYPLAILLVDSFTVKTA